LCAGANAFVEHLAPLRRKPLRIVKAAGNIVGIENDGRGDDRSGERTAPGFVASGDRPHTALERRALAAEGRADDLLFERQARRRLQG
jgi:hypothetical protein